MAIRSEPAALRAGDGPGRRPVLRDRFRFSAGAATPPSSSESWPEMARASSPSARAWHGEDALGMALGVPPLARLVRVQPRTVRRHERARSGRRLTAYFAAADDVRFEELVSSGRSSTLLRAALGGERGARSFLTGGVTFCALLPMRSVPFRILCMLGLNDTDFPRRDPKPGVRSGDAQPGARRQVRTRGRSPALSRGAALRARSPAAFLRGRAVQDNAELPPSVVIAELLDVIDATFVDRARPVKNQLALALGAGVRPRLVVEHPLQPFSPRYFGAATYGSSASSRQTPKARAPSRTATCRARSSTSPRWSSAKPARIDLDDLVAVSRESVPRDSFNGDLASSSRTSRSSSRTASPSSSVRCRRTRSGHDCSPSYGARPELRDPLDLGARTGSAASRSAWNIDAERVLGEVLALHARAHDWLEGGRTAADRRGASPSAARAHRRAPRRLRRRRRCSFASRASRRETRSRRGCVTSRCARSRAGRVDGPRCCSAEPTDPGCGSTPASSSRSRWRSHGHSSDSSCQAFTTSGQHAPLCLFPAASRRFVGSADGRANPERCGARDRSQGLLGSPHRRLRRRRRVRPSLFDGENPFDPNSFPSTKTAARPAQLPTLSRAVFEPMLAASRGGAE